MLKIRFGKLILSAGVNHVNDRQNSVTVTGIFVPTFVNLSIKLYNHEKNKEPDSF